MNIGNTTLMSASPRLLHAIHREWFASIPINAAVCLLTKKKFIGFPVSRRRPPGVPGVLASLPSTGHFYRATKSVFVEVSEDMFDKAINDAEQIEELEKDAHDTYYAILLKHLIHNADSTIIVEQSKMEPYYLAAELEQLKMRLDTRYNSRFINEYSKYTATRLPEYRRAYYEVCVTSEVITKSWMLYNRVYFYGKDVTTPFRSNLYRL
jgi:hypothetical protein